jgi:hypothetical protein
MKLNRIILLGLLLFPSCGKLQELTNPTPSPSPSPTPIVGIPVPSPSPSPLCPAYAPDNDKYMQAGVYSGNGLDVTPRVRNRSYCETLYGVTGPYDCKANVDGLFPGCDVEFLNGLHCPQWFFQDPDFGFWLKCVPGNNPTATCDHMDHYEGVGPYTGTCDVDKDGVPITGFYTLPHGDTSFKACDKTGKICSNPVRMNH